ncbi:MAG: flavin reductase family protein [Ignavibacteriales bacterium]|nr:flavin reductase family protein [Ignavibacteriales bacterium]
MSEAIDPRNFRQTLGQFATGVAVIATEVEKEVHGMTANAFTSLSLNPMLVLFCVDNRAKMSEFMQMAKGFSINFLRDDQQALSTYFAGGWKESKAPPFRFVAWSGGPRLEGCAAALGCRLHKIVKGGDHSIVIGEVLSLHLGIEPRDPLIFHSGMYRKLDKREKQPAPPDLDAAKADISVFLDPWDES